MLTCKLQWATNWQMTAVTAIFTKQNAGFWIICCINAYMIILSPVVLEWMHCFESNNLCWISFDKTVVVPKRRWTKMCIAQPAQSIATFATADRAFLRANCFFSVEFLDFILVYVYGITNCSCGPLFHFVTCHNHCNNCTDRASSAHGRHQDFWVRGGQPGGKAEGIGAKEENYQQVLWPLTTGNKNKLNIDYAVFWLISWIFT